MMNGALEWRAILGVRGPSVCGWNGMRSCNNGFSPPQYAKAEYMFRTTALQNLGPWRRAYVKGL